jgi:hypothetical protein
MPRSADASSVARRGNPGPRLSSSRRRLLIAAAALPAAACTTPSWLPPPAQPPVIAPVRAGQRWRYERIDLYTGRKTGELDARVLDAQGPAFRIALTDAQGGALGEEVWASPWNARVDLAYDPPQAFEEPMPLLPERLEPGSARFDATFYTVPGSDDRLYWRQSLRAPGWERIRVPAGSFDALRVERIIDFRHRDTWRQSCWRIDTLWYSPQVGRWVQREWTGGYLWPGWPPTRADEDRVGWRLLSWSPPPG